MLINTSLILAHPRLRHGSLNVVVLVRCDQVQCENAAVCEVSNDGTFYCKCATGYAGNYCQSKLGKEQLGHHSDGSTC